jgi:hypothetical protein
MEQGQLNRITNYIWGIAADVLRDLYVRGQYRAGSTPCSSADALGTLIEKQLSPDICRRTSTVQWMSAMERFDEP